jgi:hypothetical protein
LSPLKLLLTLKELGIKKAFGPRPFGSYLRMYDAFSFMSFLNNYFLMHSLKGSAQNSKFLVKK